MLASAEPHNEQPLMNEPHLKAESQCGVCQMYSCPTCAMLHRLQRMRCWQQCRGQCLRQGRRWGGLPRRLPAAGAPPTVLSARKALRSAPSSSSSLRAWPRTRCIATPPNAPLLVKQALYLERLRMGAWSTSAKRWQVPCVLGAHSAA